MSDRLIILDTETTGLEHRNGHRIIEIGCVEMVNRKLTGNNFHEYLNPEREIDQAAIEVHGITRDFLQNKPHFENVVEQLVDYLKGAELVIHNAPFDIGFINAELALLDTGEPPIDTICTVYDTLKQARKMFPGQRNTLDALCTRYAINNSHRELHGALLDAEILADVYLAMTGGQTDILLESNEQIVGKNGNKGVAVDLTQLSLSLIQPTEEENEHHEQWVKRLDDAVNGKCVWTRLQEKQH